MYGNAVGSLDAIRFRRRFEFLRELFPRAPLIQRNTQLSFDQRSLVMRTLLHRAPSMRTKSLRLVEHLSQTRNRINSALVSRQRPTARPYFMYSLKTRRACGRIVVKPENPSRSPATRRNKPRPAAATTKSPVGKPQLNKGDNNTRGVEKLDDRR
jgi:hypothetical protein